MSAKTGEERRRWHVLHPPGRAVAAAQEELARCRLAATGRRLSVVAVSRPVVVRGVVLGAAAGVLRPSAETIVAAAVRTFGDVVLEVRTLLQDKIPTSGSKLRYSDAEMFEGINRMVVTVRALRPDLVLGAFGPRSLRQTLPYYNAADHMATPFPFDLIIYPAFVAYLVGISELREDTFSESGRAAQMLQMAAGNLMGGGMAMPQAGGR